jgi:hypothetical protein
VRITFVNDHDIFAIPYRSTRYNAR